MSSPKELAYKIWELHRNASSAARVTSELNQGQYSAKSPDDAVERVLQFERNWAGFELPRILNAINAIQQFVFPRQGFAAGDYKAFASQVESLFQAPVVAALDEYGVPMQLAIRLQSFLDTKDDSEVALSSLMGMNAGRQSLHPFEREVLLNAQGML